MSVICLSVIADIYQANAELALMSARLEVLREMTMRYERENSIDVESWVVTEPKQLNFRRADTERPAPACLAGGSADRPAGLFAWSGRTKLSSPAGRRADHKLSLCRTRPVVTSAGACRVRKGRESDL